ncbi:uncharacterized protein [Epargyreus clarus]|uniref:uncharacterized protein n=1 Tax=Epargyreus clarus TaxID=520877 RepID=UPI003C300910
MSFSCSQCNFTTQFESALTMHQQLHHGSTVDWDPNKLKVTNEKSNTVPRAASQVRSLNNRENKELKLARTSSTTKLLGKLRARICRSKTLFVHPEEGDQPNITNLTSPSDCSSKVSRNSTPSCSHILELRGANQEIFACHLCPFDADRITVLDRHLLTDHKIGLENLLKLVLAKTQDRLSEDETAANIYGIRQPYYKPTDDIIEEGEFIIETVTPKIKILKHATVNTDLKGSDIPDLMNKYQNSEDVDKLTDLNDNRDLLAKMQTLNECMCKFVDSSNMLKKVLTKEFDQKTSARSEKLNEKPIFDLGLGDQETPRKWEKAHSEKLERTRSKYGESRSGSEKIKLPSESFYF